MGKHIYISTGDKGGVGKSVLSSLLVECRLAMGLPVVVIEGDPKQPDVGWRYASDPDVSVAPISLYQAGDAENAVDELGSYLETGVPTGHDVIVNMPAGAGETVDAQAETLRAVADGLEYRLVVLYSIDPTPLAADALADSLRAGLLSVIDPGNRHIVYPMFRAQRRDDPQSFNWRTHPARGEHEAGEVIIPALRNDKARELLSVTPGRIADICSAGKPAPNGWHIVQRSALFRFFREAVGALAPVFDVRNDEEVV